MESSSIEKIIAMGTVEGGSTEQPLCGVSAVSSPQRRQSSRTSSDTDYARQMEERYGILDEGAF